MFGSPALRAAFEVNVYVLGRDQPPARALLGPAIIITTDEDAVLGLGWAFPVEGRHATRGRLVAPAPPGPQGWEARSPGRVPPRSPSA